MNEKQKDRLVEICDEEDWKIDLRSDGCTIRTANGSRVEYREDNDDRTVDIRADGRFRTVLAVVKALDDARSIGRKE